MDVGPRVHIHLSMRDLADKHTLDCSRTTRAIFDTQKKKIIRVLQTQIFCYFTDITGPGLSGGYCDSLRVGRSGVRRPVGLEILSSPHLFRPALGLTQPPPK